MTHSHVRWQHGLNERFALPIERVQIRLETPGLLGQLVGAGDVVIIDDVAGVEHRVPGVIRGRALRASIRASQSEHAKGDAAPSATSEAGQSTTSYRIQFRTSSAAFRPTTRLEGRAWIDTSFAQSPRAIGRLRFPAVDNGRYKLKHSILDANGATIGRMMGGANSLGYTFYCVYAGDCFWISHQTFGETMRTDGSGVSGVSLVEATGAFFFSSKMPKFKAVRSFHFGTNWPNTTRAFKLLDDGSRLFYLTDYGACLFDIQKRDIVAQTDFAQAAGQWSGFALSPKTKLLALGCSSRGEADPLDGVDRYHNFVRIYDLETGVMVGEQSLPGEQWMQWTVDFSEDGRGLRLVSASSTHTFEMLVVR